MTERLILASGSATRRALLESAGLVFDVVRPAVDEAPLKAAALAEGAGPAEVAARLAAAKAAAVARGHEDAFVVGSDQVLALDGRLFDKPEGRAGLRAHIEALAGRTHSLWTALEVRRGAECCFAHCGEARLTMRPLAVAEIERYVAEAPDAALQSVGGYQVEALGIRLFERIEGDWHDILGLPLLPLLGFLGTKGLV